MFYKLDGNVVDPYEMWIVYDNAKKFPLHKNLINGQHPRVIWYNSNEKFKFTFKFIAKNSDSRDGRKIQKELSVPLKGSVIIDYLYIRSF